MRHNTNNPAPSNDPRDLNDNALILDEIMNSLEETAKDRFERDRYTVQAFHNIVIDTKAQIDPTVNAAKEAVNSTADAAIEEMQETAANLGDDLNNKHADTYEELLGMPQTRDAVVGIVDADPDESLNGWYFWSLSAGAWIRFQEQPASSSKLDALANDPARSKIESVPGEGEKRLFQFIDFLRRLTWLGVRASDGGPTDWSLHLIRERLGTVLRGFPGMLFAIVDKYGKLTDLAVRSSDGQMAEFVMVRWAKRLGPMILKPFKKLYYAPDKRGTTYKILGTDTYVNKDGEVVPILTNMLSWAGWGSSTIAQFHELGDLAQSFGATYYNGGQGSELSTHVAARMGAIPAMMTVVGGSIPATVGASVELSCSNVRPSASFKPTDGYLNGVLGRITSTSQVFTFTRTGAGDEVVSPGEYAFSPIMGADHRADVTFIYPGKNDINQALDTAGIIDRIDTCYNYLSPLNKRAIVFSQFPNVGTVPGSPASVAIITVNAANRARYGAQFFELAEYLTGSEIWTDTGITPTQDDLDQQAMGNIPPSLTIDNSAHMNATARAAVAEKLRLFILGLGWYE
jgi:hypothetical protein